MSSAHQKIAKLSVGTGSLPNVADVSFLSAKSTYEAVTGLAAIAADVCFVGTNQTSGSGLAYGLLVGSTEAGQYYGVTAEPTASHVKYANGTGALEVYGKNLLTLDTSSVSGYVNAVKDLNTQGVLSLGTYGGVDSATIQKSGTFTVAKTYTLPDISGAFILDAGAQSIGGDKTFTGTVVVPTPTAPTHAATKSYVDGVAQGLDFKNSVRLTSTANVALSGSTPLSLDSVALVDGDRVLLTEQTAGAENGIYDFADLGGTYTLTRSADADSDAEINTGMYVYTEEGTVNGGFAFVLSTIEPITLGTTVLDFIVFNQVVAYTAGNGLQLVGFEFSVASTISTDAFVAATSVTTPSIAPAVADGTITFNNADLTSIDQLSATGATIPTINATGTTTLGNVSSAMTISGLTVSVVGDTTVTGDLTADSLKAVDNTNQIKLGSDVTNHLILNAPTGALAEQKTYTLPISTTATATIPIVQGAAPPSSGYILQSTGTDHIATWVESTPVDSVRTTTTTTVTSATDLLTLTTTAGRYYLCKAAIVAKRADNSEIATYEYSIPVKNNANVLTIGTPLFSSTSYDASFTGEEITFASTGADLRVVGTPPNVASTNWKVHLSYHYSD